jgi:hypothetical protein
MTTDPFAQYHSPYLAMGNDPVNMIDPTGGIGLDCILWALGGVMYEALPFIVANAANIGSAFVSAAAQSAVGGLVGGIEPPKGNKLSSPSDFAKELKYYYKYNHNTDYHLTKERFTDIYNDAFVNNAIKWERMKQLPNGNFKTQVNFYKTSYKYAFGKASIEFKLDTNNKLQPVSFKELWDLNPKPWFGKASRSFLAESITRYYNETLKGTNFNVLYP